MSDITNAVLIEVERNSEGEVLICTGCGTVETVRSIRAGSATAFTCCPERKMVRAADFGDHGGLAGASAHEADWFELAKAMAVAVMFQRGTRGVHVVGRNGKATQGCVDLLGGLAVDELARKFCSVAGIDFEAIEPPTEHEAMFMLIAGMTWQDWLERPSTIRAKALGTGHPSRVDHGRLAQAIEAHRAATLGAVHESAVRQDAPDV